MILSRSGSVSAAAASYPDWPYDHSRTPETGSNVYHVDPAASDDTGDGSIGDPFQQINTHIGDLVAGDILYLRAGTHSVTSYNMRNTGYPEDGHNDGTSGNPIIITSYPGEEPTLNCNSQEWLNMDSVDYWHITHLKFTSTAMNCLAVGDGSDQQGLYFFCLDFNTTASTTYGDNAGQIFIDGWGS